VVAFPNEPPQELGFFAKIWNAIKGFFGFGTAGNNTSNGMSTDPGMNEWNN